jgi:hypothetical protein
MNSYNNPFYRSLLGISEIDSVNSANINTQSLTVSSLGTGLVSSTSGTLGNATVGNGLTFTGNTLNNTGVTSIVSGATGPVYISTSSTGSVEIALPQNLSVASSPNFTNLGVQNYLIVGSTSNTNSLLAASAGFVVNAISDPPLSYDNTTSRYSIALTGSTGIDYSVVGGVGYITNKFMTGPTGPIGPTGAGGTIAYYANYYSNTTQTINTTATQITFPNNFVQNGITLDVNSNITFTNAGTYQITGELQVNGSNNSVFVHWYRLNGVDVTSSSFTDNFSGGAARILSTSTAIFTVNAGDTVGIWGLRTAGTVSIEAVAASGSPAYPASPSVNVTVSQITYTQIGPTGYTGATGPIYSPGTNINIAGNVISTVTNPQFERVLNSTLGNRTILLGSGSGSSFTTGGTDCVAVGNNTLNALTTGGTSTAVGSQALRYVTTGGSNTAVGFQALNAVTTGNQNTAVGSFCGSEMTTGRFNSLLGQSAGYNITSGDTNFCLGLNSGYSITTSNDNISIGSYSMAKAANFMTGPDGRNVAIGHYSGHSLAGYPTNNVAIGYQSLWNATQCSDNIAIGTNSLATIRANGGGNIAIGGSSTSVGGSLTNGQGYNIGVGIASNLYLSANAQNNIGIGAYSNFNTSTGINNISIGPFTQALSATGCNNIVLSTNGTISVPISGRGDNTAFIDARAGLFSYNPTYCQLRSTAFNNGIVTWQFWSDGTTTYNNGFQLFLSNTQVAPPYNGLYEVTVSGSAQAQASLFVAIDLNTINVLGFRNIAYQSSSGINTYIVNVSGTQLSRPYVTSNPALSGWQVNCNGGKFFSLDFPLFMTIKWISL